MNLLELYEDTFQYVCRLNRAAKAESQPDYVRVRGEIKALFADVVRNASTDVRLLNQVKRLELPMVFFIDNLICTSRLKFATRWSENRLAKERNELAGDERFFDFLEQDLTDTSEEAAERLSIYYTLLGLGFTGMYQAQPEQIRRYLDQIFPRVRPWMDPDPSAKICEDAYRHTDTRLLTEPPNKKIILVSILFVFVSLSILALCYGLYAKAASDLTVSIKQIEKQSDAIRH
jgi:type IV/VI secretion system ImpK/VasF family protein